jgi:hypothetical protein
MTARTRTCTCTGRTPGHLSSVMVLTQLAIGVGVRVRECGPSMSSECSQCACRTRRSPSTLKDGREKPHLKSKMHKPDYNIFMYSPFIGTDLKAHCSTTPSPRPRPLHVYLEGFSKKAYEKSGISTRATTEPLRQDTERLPKMPDQIKRWERRKEKGDQPFRGRGDKEPLSSHP